MIYEKVRTIEFEVTTTCNSFCPVCVRFQLDNDGVWLNPLVDFNQHLSVEHLTKILSDPYVADNVSLDFIGTAGDPIAHPNFLEILEVAKKLKPKASFNIHTNGGLRNPDYYEKLAKLLSSVSHYDVQFSIDGLKDTNHIYRIGVQWSRLMDNLRAFVKAGGKPRWQMVIFPWNKHQVNEVEKFAKTIGCAGFDTRQNVYTADLDLLMEKAKTNFYKTEFLPKSPFTDFNNVEKNFKYIDDACISKEGIFVRPEGHIFPCCMFSASAYDKHHNELLKETYFTSYEKGWNEIEKHSLSKIMNSQWWTDLKTGLDNNKPCDLCIHHCGVVDKKSRHDIDEVKTEFANEN
tara:strand:+ start:51 stop:1091 length:1041 start_codon:yes stop_codon:yes gene_type:complete